MLNFKSGFRLASLSANSSARKQTPEAKLLSQLGNGEQGVALDFVTNQYIVRVS